MGKLIDLTGLGEFKTKLLNLIKPQLDASVSTVNSKSATNHAVVINADDIKMSSSENVTIPNKLKQYVKSVNGSTPDPITGDVVVAGGGGDTSVGLIRRSIGIATTAWQGSGPFTYTYSDPDIAVGMCVLEAYLSDEYAQLGINSYTIQNGSLIISTTVKPTADWNLTIALGMDGSTFMEDVSDLKTKVGNGTIDTTATTLIGAVNELNARKGSGITVSNTDSRSIATAITEQSQQIGNVTLPTVAQTLTGAIAENSKKISDLGPINNLTSDSTTAALSAAQGKALKGLLPNYKANSGLTSGLYCVTVQELSIGGETFLVPCYLVDNGAGVSSAAIAFNTTQSFWVAINLKMTNGVVEATGRYSLQNDTTLGNMLNVAVIGVYKII